MSYTKHTIFPNNDEYNGIMITRLPSHPLWGFSLYIYGQTVAKETLLALQNQYGMNVNIVLYCCWVATINYGQLTKQDIKQLVNGIDAWHESVVANLRSLRDLLKEAANKKPWAKELRENILSVELTAEHIEQLMLIDVGIRKQINHRRTNYQRAGNACHNIANYCRVQQITVDQVGCAFVSQLINVVFPELNAVETLNLCKSVFFSKQPPEQPSKHKQLQLKLRN